MRCAVTDRPLHSLAAALLSLLEPELSEVNRLAEVGKLAGHIADSTVTLRDLGDRVLTRQPGTDRLLLFVDQWEESYTRCADDGRWCRVNKAGTPSDRSPR